MARLAADSRRDLLSLSAPRAYPADAVLIRQGEPDTHVYVLRSVRRHMSTCVKVTGLLENGHEGLLAIRVSGDLVGELAFLRDVRRSATVTTCAPALVHPISREAFLSFLQSHPDAWRAISGMLADKLEWANQRRLDFGGYDVPVRLARALVALVDRHGCPTSDGYDLGVELSHAELGRLIGAGKDAASKAIAILRRRGLVRTSYRRVTVTHLDALRAYGGSAV